MRFGIVIIIQEQQVLAMRMPCPGIAGCANVAVSLPDDAPPSILKFRFKPVQKGQGLGLIASVIHKQHFIREAKVRHIVEGLLIALAYIDEIIRIIRGSANPKEAQARLMGLEVSAEILRLALNDQHPGPAPPPT